MTIGNQYTPAQRRALMALQARHYTKPQGLSAACHSLRLRFPGLVLGQWGKKSEGWYFILTPAGLAEQRRLKEQEQ